MRAKPLIRWAEKTTDVVSFAAGSLLWLGKLVYFSSVWRVLLSLECFESQQTFSSQETPRSPVILPAQVLGLLGLKTFRGGSDVGRASFASDFMGFLHFISLGFLVHGIISAAKTFGALIDASIEQRTCGSISSNKLHVNCPLGYSASGRACICPSPNTMATQESYEQDSQYLLQMQYHASRDPSLLVRDTGNKTYSKKMPSLGIRKFVRRRVPRSPYHGTIQPHRIR